MRCYPLSIFSALTWHKTDTLSRRLNFSFNPKTLSSSWYLELFRATSRSFDTRVPDLMLHMPTLKNIFYRIWSPLLFSPPTAKPSRKITERKAHRVNQTKHKSQHKSCLHKHQVSDKHTKVISPKTIWCGHSIIPNVCPVVFIKRVQLQSFKDTVD